MSVEVPNVHVSRARLQADIARQTDPRHRTMLEIWRDHWWGEVENNVPAVMATLPPDRVSYLFDGVPLFFPRAIAFGETAQAQSLYENAAATGLPMAGPFENERWAFADWGIACEGVLSSIVRGRSLLSGTPAPVVADALYLVSWRLASFYPIDVERRLMLGEHAYSGSLVRLVPATADMLDQMYRPLA